MFTELDAAWPRRDRRTDGWYRAYDPVVPNSDHIPDSRGRVHAIDIDKDGIDPDFVVSRAIRQARTTSYVIWNRRIWGYWNKWRPEKYTGTSNPHTDHIHVSIFHTDVARKGQGPWGIAEMPDVKIPKGKIDSFSGEISFARGLTTGGDRLVRAARTFDEGARAIKSIYMRHR